MSGPFGSSQWMYSSGGGFYPYEIDQSLRFDKASNTYLSRSPASDTNRKTWTWSGWLKRGSFGPGVSHQILSARSGLNFTQIAFRDDEQIAIGQWNGSPNWDIYTNAVYRDVSAWYHIVVAFDTTQATSTDRIKVYVNGEQVTSFASTNYPSQNSDSFVNSTTTHNIGRTTAGSDYFDGYMAEVNFVDGQALDPTSFGEFKSGVWVAKSYTGSYGTNGFYLDFSNSGSLGADSSGNSNNWTANNLAATDVVLDSPTNNFCVMNPLAYGFAVPDNQEGNLRIIGTSPATDNDAQGHATWTVGSGKWYFEHLVQHVSDDWIHLGVTDVSNYDYMGRDGFLGQRADQWACFLGTGTKRNNGSTISYGSSFAAGDIAMTALDMDSGKIWWGKNGTWFASGDPAAGTNAAFTNLSGYEVTPAFTARDNGVFNFGQDSSFAGGKTAQGNTDGNSQGDFYYTPPSGYLALCSANLSVAESVDPAEDNSPQDYFNTVLYNGTSSTQNITGVGFQPDFVWVKRRDADQSAHCVTDIIRGGGIVLNPTFNYADQNYANAAPYNFASDGFSVSTDDVWWNRSGGNYVSWNWLASNTTASNTAGSITTTVSSNPDAGFSILTYTGNGSNSTLGHGLNNTPRVIFCKRRDGNASWRVYHRGLGATKRVYLDETGAAGTSSIVWNNTEPTSSVFSIGTDTAINQNNSTFVAYVWAEVEGYSSMNTWTGNGNSDGPFVYTGFRPQWLLIRRTDATGNWVIFDDERNQYNLTNLMLFPNSPEREDSSGYVDFLSNGFKWRSTNGTWNSSGGQYIYMAFASNPFKYALAR